MSKGMKILRACMLTLLLTLCAAVVVAVFVHGRNSDNDSSQYLKKPKVDVEEEDFIFDMAQHLVKENPREDTRLWQRASSKQDDTGLWQFYPIIPLSVKPGETAVLSVSSKGFKGWEVDPYFAQVELFNEEADDENVYISFIMPDDKVYIAALYDEIPQINYDNAKDMVMSLSSMIEHGAVPMPASDSGFTPAPLVPVELPFATIGQMYNPVVIRAPVGMVDDGTRYTWTWPGKPDWLEFNRTPTAMDVDEDGDPIHVGGGNFFDNSNTVGGPHLKIRGDFYFRLDITDNTTGEIYMYTFFIQVRRAEAIPEILTSSVPDAMVGIDYFTLFNTSNIPTTGQWEWELISGGKIPDSLFLKYDLLDPSRASLEGRPVVTDLTNGNSPNGSAVYSFRIIIEERKDLPALHPGIYIESDEDLPYNIRVWYPPDITTPDVPGSILGTIAPLKLYEGITNPNGTYGFAPDYNVDYTAIRTSGVTPGSVNDVLNPLVRPTVWSWGIVDIQAEELPPGLTLPAPLAPPPMGLSVSVGGQAIMPGTYTFTIRFSPTQSDISGWVDKKYTIKILAPPSFPAAPSTLGQSIRLNDGMENQTGTIEPLEDARWYTDDIDMVGFPVGTRWRWSIPAIGTLPEGIDYWGVPLDLTWDNGAPGSLINEPTLPPAETTYPYPVTLYGIPRPTARGEYRFSIQLVCEDATNSNINGARVTQTFDIKIWPRTYLRAISDSGRIYVRRDNDDEPTFDAIAQSLPLQGQYEGRRAVMPGTRGMIHTNTGGASVRWEVSPIITAAGTIPNESNYSTASNLIEIGGRDSTDSTTGRRTGWGIHSQTYAYTVINMPETRPDPGISVSDNRDVHVRAFQLGQGRPVFSPLGPGLEDATVGAVYREAISIEGELGGGPKQPVWQMFPEHPELKINRNALDINIINGTPTSENLQGFNFTLRITLPGTMVIERDYRIIINPWDALGDVNGDGVVDLRDLVLLVRFQDNPTLNINRRNSSLATGGQEPYDLGMPSIRILTRYLASFQGSMNQTPVTPPAP